MMILIGQYDSPFVRRVAVALRIYDLAFEHRPWSTFRDAEAIAAYNPLRRVPTLILDDGEVLIESGAILDHIDGLVEPARALVARTGAERRAVLRLCALATGLCDKMVSLVYERALHDTTSAAWIERCETQVAAALDALERDLGASGGAYWLGERLSHADIATTCATRFLREAHGAIYNRERWPGLCQHADRYEATSLFREVVQVFIPSA